MTKIGNSLPSSDKIHVHAALSIDQEQKRMATGAGNHGREKRCVGWKRVGKKNNEKNKTQIALQPKEFHMPICEINQKLFQLPSLLKLMMF